MERDEVYLFSDVSSANNGGKSSFGQQSDSLMLNSMRRNIIQRYNHFRMILDINMPGIKLINETFY